MAMPDRPELRQVVSAENPAVDPDKLLGDLALDLERQLRVITDETRQSINAAKITAQTQREVTDPENGLIGYDPAYDIQQQPIEDQSEQVSGGEEKHLRDYTEAEVLGNWDRIGWDLNGVEERTEIIRKQIQRVKNGLELLVRLKANERLRHRFSEIVEVPDAAVSAYAQSAEDVEVLRDRIRLRIVGLVLDQSKLGQLNRDCDSLLHLQQSGDIQLTDKDKGWWRVKHIDLHRALVALEKLQEEVEQERSNEQVIVEKDDSGQEAHRKHIPFKERLAIARQLIEEWKDVVRQSGMKDEELRAAIAERLGKKAEDVLDVRAFAKELQELGGRHHWEGDVAKGDKSHVRIEMRHLEEIMPHARAIVAEQTGKVFANKHGEISDQMGVTPDRSTPGRRDDRPQGKPRMDAVLAPSGELERKITNLRRWDHELQFRDPNGDVFLVRPTKNEYMYELRDNSSSSRIVHFRELATLLYEKQVVIDGEYTWQPNALSREVRRTVREGMIDGFGPDELQTWWDDAERTWEDRIRFVQTQLNRWGVVADRFQQTADGARILKQEITRLIPEYEPLALDTGVYETRDLIRQAQELATDGTLETEEQGGLRNQLRQRCLAYQNILKVAQEAPRKLTAGRVTLREREKAVREIERELVEKLKVFVERMNEKLLQQEPGMSYARRRGRVLAQMPEFAELMLNLPQYQSVALSSDERDAMIEKNTASIQIPK